MTLSSEHHAAPDHDVSSMPADPNGIVQKRPLGVHILTALNVIISGLFPILAAVAFVLQSGTDLFNVVLTLIQVGFAGAIIWSSIGAWRGDDRARRTLLGVMTAYYLLQIATSVGLLVALGVTELALARVLGLTARSLFWISINRWYFSRPQTLAWYQQRQRME
jgi:VIT1/CCC1 family predicted Fe2+/Mn2+ transporter